MIEIQISLEVTLGPGYSVYLEDMRLRVDKYMYERYKELGELDKWLQWQALSYIQQHSKVRYATINLGDMPPWARV